MLVLVHNRLYLSLLSPLISRLWPFAILYNWILHNCVTSLKRASLIAQIYIVALLMHCHESVPNDCASSIRHRSHHHLHSLQRIRISSPGSPRHVCKSAGGTRRYATVIVGGSYLGTIFVPKATVVWRTHVRYTTIFVDVIVLVVGGKLLVVVVQESISDVTR